MTLFTPLYLQATGGDPTFDYSAQLDRQLISSLFRGEGVIPPGGTNALVTGGLKVTQRGAGADFSVDISFGACIITGDSVANQGNYLAWSDASVNRATPSAPGTGTRTHRVVARIRDKLHDGTATTYDWVLEVLQDTGSGVPAVPNSAISLATISIAAGQTSVTNANITDTRSIAVLNAQRPPIVSSDAGRPPVPSAGDRVFRSDHGYDEVYDGSTWIPISGRPEPVHARDTDAGTTTSTSGTETLTGAAANVSVSFDAPSSGKAMIRFGAQMKTSNDFNDVMFGVRVKVTSGGATFYTSTDAQAAMTDDLNNSSPSNEIKVSGLTPGTNYTVVGFHKVETGTTGTYDNRWITVSPI